MSAALFVVTVASVSSIQAQVDARFATPERALETYIDALRRGDVLTVTECFNAASSFDLPGAIPIESYPRRSTKRLRLRGGQGLELGRAAREGARR